MTWIKLRIERRATDCPIVKTLHAKLIGLACGLLFGVVALGIMNLTHAVCVGPELQEVPCLKCDPRLNFECNEHEYQLPEGPISCPGCWVGP